MEQTLLLLAGEAVFSPKQTGYGDKEPLVSTHVTELLNATKGSE